MRLQDTERLNALYRQFNHADEENAEQNLRQLNKTENLILYHARQQKGSITQRLRQGEKIVLGSA